MPISSSASRGWIAGIAFLCAATPAYAHALGEGFNDFWGGVVHPAIAFDQAAAIIGLGLILARFPEDDERPLFPIAFVSILGGLIVGGYLPAEWSSLLIPIALMVTGFALINIKEVSTRAPQTVIAFYGIINGLSFGVEIPEASSDFLFSAGILSTTTITVGYTLLLWQKFSRPWCEIAVRIIGSWLFAIGLMVLGLELRPIESDLPTK